MVFLPFLAMTAGEIGNISDFPPRIAWMACHFSPYGPGLSNLPRYLPPESMVLVDDATPIRGHDAEVITQQLTELTENLHCRGILLDFQRPDSPEAASLAKHLSGVLPCPVIVSEHYAAALTGPVFLSAAAPSVPLQEYLKSWQGREVWLEAGLTGETLTLTERGCRSVPLPYPDIHLHGFEDRQLHCHYRMEANKKSARFTLWRTHDDLQRFMEEALNFGVTDFIGLYQELGFGNEEAKTALP